MTGDLMTRSGFVYRMRCSRSGSRGNRLSTSQMHRRLARYLRSETKTDAAVVASLISHRA